MKAYVDPEVCIGCALCTQICPEIFRMEQDKAVASADDVPEQFKDSCNNAANDCPVSAIKIIE